MEGTRFEKGRLSLQRQQTKVTGQIGGKFRPINQYKHQVISAVLNPYLMGYKSL